MYYVFDHESRIKLHYLFSINYVGWQPKRVELKEYDVILTENSNILIEHNDIKFKLGPCEAYLALPGETMKVLPQSTRQGIYIMHFTAQSHKEVESIDLSFDKDEFYLSRHMHINDKKLFRILNNMIAENVLNRHCKSLRLGIMLSELFLLFTNSIYDQITGGHIGDAFKSDTQRKVKEITYFFNNNYMYPITSDDIAQLVRLNYNYINTLFKSSTGMTIMRYLETIRMQNAGFFLRTTSMKIKEIAAAVGYNDAYYFSKCYKKFDGFSPEKTRLDNSK